MTDHPWSFNLFARMAPFLCPNPRDDPREFSNTLLLTFSLIMPFRPVSSVIRLIALVLLPAQILSSPMVLLGAVQRDCCPGTQLPQINVSLSTAPPPDTSDAALPAQDQTIGDTTPVTTPAQVVPTFSGDPVDEEITRSHIFAEPLIPVGERGDPSDNQSLAGSLQEFLNATDETDVDSLTAHMANHPQSRWGPALLLNLGMLHADRFYFSKAETALRAAWDATSHSVRHREKLLADRAAGELAELYARLGRTDKLEAFLRETETREFLGSARQKIVAAREELNFMWFMPDHAFGCGAAALDVIRTALAPNAPRSLILLDPEAPVGGYTLKALNALAARAHVPGQMAKRVGGAVFPVPSVIHWNAGHYSALIGRRGARYHVRDGSFGLDRWVTQAALDEEASGYALIPAGDLPQGWLGVSDSEGDIIRGGCHIATCDDGQSKKCNNHTGNCPRKGMAAYNIHLMIASLSLSDNPVGYTPPKGMSMEFTVTYNQREANQPSTFTYSNTGRLWAFNWLSYINDNPSSPASDVTIYERGGGTETYTGFVPSDGDPATFGSQWSLNQYCSCRGAFQPDLYGQAVLKRTSATTCATNGQVILPSQAPLIYERTFPDGTKETYDLATPGNTSRKVFLTKITLRDGSATTFTYDTNFRLIKVTDPLGQVTTLTYGLTNDIYKITAVTDPFGRRATLQYSGSGQLVKITDAIGITSQFTYGANDFVNKLTTPYGDSVFAFGETNPGNPMNTRWIETTDPLGGKERVEYTALPNPAISTDVAAQIPQGMATYNSEGVINCRNTYYWDKKAMMEGPGDYAMAQIYHWADSPNSGANMVSDVIEATKAPFENWVWYNYPGQDPAASYIAGTIAQPSVSGRVLGDGTSQLTQYAYNSLGNPTQITDPHGRVTTISYYGNGIDVFQVKNTTGGGSELLAEYGTYNAQHQPSYHKNAAGQVTGFTYNAFGQKITETNAKSEQTVWTYDSNGYLRTITRPWAGAVSRFSYDVVGRMRTFTDSEGYALTFDYDSLDRLVKVAHPDGTYEQTIFSRLDPQWRRDRLGRWTYFLYDSARRLSAVQDPAGRLTQYDWCTCGALHSIIDGNGHTTTFVRDAQSRLTAKIFDDGSQTTYFYEPGSSRLQRVTEANGQTEDYTYYEDDTLKDIAFGSGAGLPVPAAAPKVTFDYDAKYRRVAHVSVARTGGNEVTTYAYYPIQVPAALGAGRLASETSPLAAVSYTYDELGRVKTLSVDGTNNTVTYAYDALGRVQSVSNELGRINGAGQLQVAFGYAYVNSTPRLQSITYPTALAASYQYFGNTGDNRLQEIRYAAAGGGAMISQHDYTYDAAGRITTWSQARSGRANPWQWSFGYDGADQLTSATLQDTGTGTVQEQDGYNYDLGGNRTLAQSGSVASAVSYTSLNEIQSIRNGGGGSLWLEGTLSKPVTGATVNGVAASVDASKNFRALVPVEAGTNTIAIQATDAANSQTTSKSYQVIVPSALQRTPLYDLNGDMTSDGLSRTYSWDAAGRLASISYAGSTLHSDFTYDGVGRMIKLEEKDGTIVNTTRQFVWVGHEIAEERNASNQVVRRFFPQGEQLTSGPAAGTLLYYTRDHLGTVREAVDSSGTIRARYDYDSYGQRSANLITSNALEATFGYTGHYFHTQSALHLAPFRAYDAQLGIWLSRDPFEEKGGINLYSYVLGNPISFTDPFGLDGDNTLAKWVVSIVSAINIWGGADKNGVPGALPNPISQRQAEEITEAENRCRRASGRKKRGER